MKPNLVEFRSQRVLFRLSPLMGESRKNTVLNAIGLRSVSYHGILSGLLGKAPSQCRGMKPNLVELRSQRVLFRHSSRSGRKSKKHRFERNWTTFGFIPRLFALGLEKPGTQNSGMKPNLVELRSQRVFLRHSPRSGRKSKKHRFERNWTTFGFIPRLFEGAFKSPLKIVV